jgi:hypothetical protein
MGGYILTPGPGVIQTTVSAPFLPATAGAATVGSTLASVASFAGPATAILLGFDLVTGLIFGSIGDAINSYNNWVQHLSPTDYERFTSYLQTQQKLAFQQSQAGTIAARQQATVQASLAAQQQPLATLPIKPPTIPTLAQVGVELPGEIPSVPLAVLSIKPPTLPTLAQTVGLPGTQPLAQALQLADTVPATLIPSAASATTAARTAATAAGAGAGAARTAAGIAGLGAAITGAGAAIYKAVSPVGTMLGGQLSSAQQAISESPGTLITWVVLILVGLWIFREEA